MALDKEGNFFTKLFKQRAKSVEETAREKEKAERKEALEKAILSERLDRSQAKVVRKFGVSRDNLKETGLRLTPHVLQIASRKGGSEFLLAVPVNEELGRIVVLSELGKKDSGIKTSEFVKVELLKNKKDWWGTAGYQSSRHCYSVTIQISGNTVSGEIELGDFWEIPEPADGKRVPEIRSAGTVVDPFGRDKGEIPLILTKELGKDDLIINVAGISETSNFQDFKVDYNEALSRIANII